MSVFELVHGVEGNCLLLDDTRIAGPKPWGGGRIVTTFITEEKYVPERTCRDLTREEFRPRYFYCSNCDYDGETGAWHVRYCPHCGARVEQ